MLVLDASSHLGQRNLETPSKTWLQGREVQWTGSLLIPIWLESHGLGQLKRTRLHLGGEHGHLCFPSVSEPLAEEKEGLFARLVNQFQSKWKT